MTRPARTAMVVLIGLSLSLPLGVAALAQAASDPGMLQDGEWALVAIDGTSVPADAGVKATFGVDGLVSGSAGCVGFSGPYSVDGGAITIGPLENQPGPPVCTSAGLAAEPKVLDGLAAAEAWSVEEDVLTLVPGPGVGGLTFERSGATDPDEDTATTGGSTLSSVEWLLIPRRPTKAQVIAVRFQPDGMLSATTACFSLSGSYKVDGRKLSVSASKDLLGQQRCEFGVLGAADNFLNVLKSAKSWKVDKKGRLTIKPDATYKGVKLVFKPGDAIAPPADVIAPPADVIAPPADIDLQRLAGPWRLRATTDPSGEYPVPDNVEITLALGADGRLQGNAGCSDYDGAYTLADGDVITIAGISTTDSTSCDATLQGMQDVYILMLPLVDGFALEEGGLLLDVGQLGKLVFEPAP